MTSDRALFALFDDLEMQAEGLALDARGEVAAALGDAEYAGIALVDRLAGSVGSPVRLRLVGGLVLNGRLARVAQDWVLLEDESGGDPWLVPARAVAVASGPAERVVTAEARGALARLGSGTVLRRLAAERRECVAHLLDGSLVQGVPARVGADFVELRTHPEPGERHGGTELLALTALAALRSVGRG